MYVKREIILTGRGGLKNPCKGSLNWCDLNENVERETFQADICVCWERWIKYGWDGNWLGKIYSMGDRCYLFSGVMVDTGQDPLCQVMKGLKC